MLVRFFAGAAEAAGVDETTIDVPPGATGDDVLALLARGDDNLARVLGRSTLLVDGVRTDRDQVVGGASSIDVLPPFAGG